MDGEEVPKIIRHLLAGTGNGIRVKHEMRPLAEISQLYRLTVPTGNEIYKSLWHNHFCKSRFSKSGEKR